MVNFCYDDLGEFGIGYPNLAPPNLAPDKFDSTWPCTVPWRALMYFESAGIEIGTHLIDTAPNNSFYPVALSWFDHNCDYFSLMHEVLLARLHNATIKVLFYYHEGDNPTHIKTRLDQLCQQHQLPCACYVFVSANSAAQHLPGFVYFADHEYFFRYLNRRQIPGPISPAERLYNFTALNRTHKWWRASCMADLERDGLLDNSIWSYNTNCDIDDKITDNPIEITSISGLKPALEDFLTNGPYFCDSNNDDQHNDHRRVNPTLYDQSYCHIVLETLFDADGSHGTFLTEKTYKAIKYSQPFVIVGPPGSLKALREQGYRVFDHAVDNSYDDIVNNTQRWLAVKRTIKQIKESNLHAWYLSCLDDVKHNQDHFLNPQYQTLHKLLEDIYD